MGKCSQVMSVLLKTKQFSLAAQVGRAEGSFEVDDDHKTRILISAKLPGYKLNSQELEKSPLSVKVLGHRSVVVTEPNNTKTSPLELS